MTRSLILVFLMLLLSACAGQKPKSYNVQLDPKISVSPLRTVINKDINVIVPSTISEVFKIDRGNKMVHIEVGNFRGTIINALSKTLGPQFKNVHINTAETGKGLELVIVSADYPEPVDVLAYHFALMNEGKLVYEYKGKTNPGVRAVGMTVYTWQDQTSKLTTEFLEINVGQMAEQTRDQLLMNEKLVDFWGKLENSQAD